MLCNIFQGRADWVSMQHQHLHKCTSTIRANSFQSRCAQTHDAMGANLWSMTTELPITQEFNQQRIVTICIASKLVLALMISLKRLSGMRSKSISIGTSPNASVSCFTCCSVNSFAEPRSGLRMHASFVNVVGNACRSEAGSDVGGTADAGA